jgi:hypothetical protein
MLRHKHAYCSYGLDVLVVKKKPVPIGPSISPVFGFLRYRKNTALDNRLFSLGITNDTQRNTLLSRFSRGERPPTPISRKDVVPRMLLKSALAISPSVPTGIMLRMVNWTAFHQTGDRIRISERPLRNR